MNNNEKSEKEKEIKTEEKILFFKNKTKLLACQLAT
jgi:hypothetical protein